VLEFEDNIRKIDRSLEAFTAHADNLSHVKLSLARVAAFASLEGNVAQLVCRTAHPMLVEPPNFTAVRPALAEPSNASMIPGRRESQMQILGPNLGQSRSFGPSPGRPERQLERQLERSLDRMPSPIRPDDRRDLAAMSSNRIPNSTCFVFYLPPSATNETLRQLFMRYGTVLNAYVAMDKVTNRTRGFGFVDFCIPSEAQAAVAGLDRYPLEGKFLSVSIKV
jgi:hypothetical protein